MKIFMVGEAFAHKSTLLEHLKSPKPTIIGLSSDAAWSDAWDDMIEPDDVVITLNYSRKESKPSFRLLHVPGAGIDGINVKSLMPNCLLCNVYEHQIPIAEYVISAILEWQIGLMNLVDFDPKEWSSIYAHRKFHGELYGKTVGIIGYGGIGHEIAKRASAFGVHVIGFDKYAKNTDGLEKICLDVETLMQESDFVVLACPLTEETRNMVNAPMISMMKPTSVLVNISRGALVEESALYEALSEHKIAGAILDVWWNYPKVGVEPLPANLPFDKLPNIIRTPHSCAWTDELFERRYKVIAENINSLVVGNKLKNLINF